MLTDPYGSTYGEPESTPKGPGYFAASRTARWGFIMALPLIALYEWGIVAVNRGDDTPVRITAEVWLRIPIQMTGIPEIYMVPALVVLIGLFIFIRGRHLPISYRPMYPLLMIIESAIYAVGLAFVAGQATELLLNLSAVTQEAEQLSWTTEMVLSIGAGIYEELLFRVILVGFTFLVLRAALPNAKKWVPYTLAAVAGALLFSLVHYLGPHGDPLELTSYTYRVLGGLILNVIFLTRGFGVAAWTHALYDVYVVSGFFG